MKNYSFSISFFLLNINAIPIDLGLIVVNIKSRKEKFKSIILFNSCGETTTPFVAGVKAQFGKTRNFH